jgi:histidinol-phosphate/aromatic aminotransferase/cobyric acid decarboxylase-like protein
VLFRSINGIKVFLSKGNSVLLNVDGTGKIAEDYVQHLWDKGFIVRNLSGGRNMESKGFFRVTVGTQKDMEQVAQIIKDFTKA